MKGLLIRISRVKKRYIHIAGIVIFFVAVSLLIAQIPTESLISLIGSENAWFLMFVLGAIGGLSTFVTIPYHVVLMSLASAGINPVMLGIATALGVMVGDSTMFLLSKQVQSKLTEKQQKKIEGWSLYIKRHPRLLTPALVTYGTISPFSNDFIVAGLSLMNFKYRQIIIPLTVGNIIYNIGIAYMGLYFYQSLFGG